MADGTFDITGVESLILREIEMGLYRNSIALTYAIGLQSHEQIDWRKVNSAILDRWSPAGLKYIKERAWKIVDQGQAQTTAK